MFKFNRQIAKTGKIDAHNTHRHDRSRFALYIVTSMKVSVLN